MICYIYNVNRKGCDVMDENKKEELLETMMSVDKNLKAMVRKSFKQLFISVSPFLLLLLTPILPKTFFP